MARHRAPKRDYPRTARVNALLQEIIGDEIERVDDDRLELLTVTGVVCEPDLRHATVTYDSLRGPDADDEVIEALGAVRPRLQRAVARQARLKRTPELRFEPDAAIRSGERIDEVLRSIEPGGGDDTP
jgi:ribosome-binding factor A